MSDSNKIHVKPIIWENFLLLSFDIKWIEIFGQIPEFELSIENDRLIILSQKLKGKNNV